MAAVVLDPAAQDLDLETLRAWCLPRLARYAVPHQLVILDDLPRSAIGKVQRRVVRDGILADPEQARA